MKLYADFKSIVYPHQPLPAVPPEGFFVQYCFHESFPLPCFAQLQVHYFMIMHKLLLIVFNLQFNNEKNYFAHAGTRKR